MQSEQLTKHVVRINSSGTTIFRIRAMLGPSILFFLFWLVAWVVGSISMLVKTYTDLFRSGHVDVFNLAWSFGWAFGLVAVLWHILWSLGGRDSLLLSASELNFEKTIFGLTFLKRPSLLSEVRNLRYVPAYGSHRRRRESCICYENSKGTVKVGSGLPDFEALSLIEALVAMHLFKKDRALEYVDLHG